MDQAARYAVDLAISESQKDVEADQLDNNPRLKALARTNLFFFNQIRTAMGAGEISPAEYKEKYKENL